jgi:hypothetical protein
MFEFFLLSFIKIYTACGSVIAITCMGCPSWLMNFFYRYISYLWFVNQPTACTYCFVLNQQLLLLQVLIISKCGIEVLKYPLYQS